MRPLNLPLYVVLLPAPDRRRLAWEVGNLMADLDHTVFLDDVNAPLYAAWTEMWNKDFGKDYLDTKVNQALMLEALKPDTTEADCIESLRGWFEDNFGLHKLGELAAKRAVDQQAITEYIYTIRDAYRNDVFGFVNNSNIRHARDIMYVALSTQNVTTEPFSNITHNWFHISATDPAEVLRLMEIAYARA